MNAIAQELLNIQKKTRSNLFKWNGQFSPQFIETILNNYSLPNQTVLDPFSGSGTVLYEASKLNLNVYGCDINPSAHKISRIYEMCNISPQDREIYICEFYELAKKTLDKLNKKNTSSYPLKMDKELKKSDKFVRILTEGYIIISDKLPYNENKVSLLKLLEEYIDVIRELPFNKNNIVSYQADCRKLPLDDNTVDLVITSPPYINVFNYHQQYRNNAEALGYDILSIAKSEIGSNRKFRSNRFYTVFQYILDISICLKELSRVCKKEAKIIFIVGKVSSILGTTINNGAIIQDIIKSLGFDVKFVQERAFKNKFGKMITEEIITIVNTKDIIHSDVTMLKIGRIHLENCLHNLKNDKLRKLILDAIDKSDKIIASPIYYN